MRDFDYSSAIDFLESFYRGTEHAVELRALANDGSLKPAVRFTRDPQIVTDLCERYDGEGRGIYFAIATRLNGSRSGKREDLAELPGLWVDIDVYKLTIDKDAALVALEGCPLPPTVVVDSGGGLHAYWLFHEPLDVRWVPEVGKTDAVKGEIDGALKQLAGVFAGDTASCDVTRILRLVGTHNTKDGTLRPVVILEASGNRYELSDVLDMLDIQRPLIARPQTASEPDAKDPFIGYGDKYGFKAPIDVIQRLSAMRYQAPPPNGIHQTRLSVSASLTAQGVDDDTIFEMLLNATHRAAGLDGQHWNWKREERMIWGEINTGRQKYNPLSGVKRSDTERKVVQLRPIDNAVPDPDDDLEPNPEPSKPTIRIRAGELHETATIAEGVLKTMGAPLYTRSGFIVKPVMEDVEASRGLRTMVARLSKVSVVGMVDWLSRTANWIKYDGRSKKWVAADPPAELAATILSRDGEWILPPVAGVITTPTMRPDGSILDTEGYDPVTRLLLLSPPAMPPLPVTPGKEDALAALSLLNSLLCDFCFVDAASRSVGLSALITPIVRGALTVSPLHAMRAPTAGSGKSYLVDIASAIATGQRCPVITAGKTEEEQEKRLGGALMAGQSIISIDNLNGELSGDALCQMVERPVVRLRPLGRSDLVQVESKATVYATGNNIVIVGDMVRRVVLCSLDVEMERPELRQFAHDPLDTILNDRGKFVAACLTIVRAYKVAGCPSPRPALASFEDWSRLVRSALVWLGQADPVDTMEAARAEDPETTDIQNVFAGWKEAVGLDAQKSVSEIIAIADQKEFEMTDDPYQKTIERGYSHAAFREALMTVASDQKGVSTRRLGRWLSRYKGRVVAGLRIIGVMNADVKTYRWSLAPARPAVRDESVDPARPPF